MNARARAALTVLFIACGKGTPSVRLPHPPATTPAAFARGDSLFAAHCVRCHGSYALGSDSGPPLLHPMYAPSHHADIAFLLAVRSGVRAHHWTFGDMPPVPDVSDAQSREITVYLRWLQAQAGVR